jgi:hypothetical protein
MADVDRHRGDCGSCRFHLPETEKNNTLTMTEFKKLMTDAFIASPHIREAYSLTDGLTFEQQFSPVSIESILFGNVATAMDVLQDMFDRFRSEITAEIDDLMPGTAKWYAHMAKRFQFGRDLVPDTDYYDNTGLTDEQIEAERIVGYAAAIESKASSILYLKVAAGNDAGRRPLSTAELAAFKAYINAVGFAGVYVSTVNAPADDIRLTIDVWYDPLVLDGAGKRLDGKGDTPVQDAIRRFLANLPFNGVYTNQSLTDAMQQTQGVIVAEIRAAWSRTGNYINYTPIDAMVTAYSGYFVLQDSNLTLNFKTNEELL